MRKQLYGSLIVLAMLVPVMAAAQEPASTGQTQPQVISPFVDSDFDKDQPIKPGFIISVFVSTAEGPEDVSGTFQVDGSGAIIMKLAGRIQVQDLRPAQAAAAVAAAFKSFIKEPKVTVNIVSVPKPIVYLVGGVVRPGAVAINRGSTLGEVLALIGFGPDADLSRVRVTRREGESRVTKVYDLNKWLRPNPGQDPDETQNPVLDERDIILVPLKNSPATGQVSVEGDISKPGIVPLRYGVGNRIREVLALSGGLNPTATYSVTIRRSGQPTPISIDYPKAEAGDPQHKIELRPDDVVFVSRLGEEQFISVNGAFARPGRQPIRNSKTLTEAIDDAGGVLLNAREKEGRIFRTGPLGDPTRTQVIPFDYKQLREGKIPDIALQPGDAVDIPNGQPKERFNLLQWVPTVISALFLFRR